MGDEMTKISWRREAATIACRLCAYQGEGEQVLRLVAPRGSEFAPVECPRCLSLQIVDEPIEFSQTEFEVSAYVNIGVGIDSIASMVSSMPADEVTNFVDIGCGFGFSLAIARDLYDWNVSGFEPSPLGLAGAETWRLDIRHEYFTPETKLAAQPDFILSSEVIEHVPNPLAFLITLREQMSPDAVLMLSTPNRAVVVEESASVVVEAALSPGFHVFVASAEGMRILLDRAGFRNFKVEERGETLFIGASQSRNALDKLSFGDISRGAIEDWYRRALTKLEVGSLLHLSLGRRLFDSYIATGKLSEARVLRGELQSQFELVFGTQDFDAFIRHPSFETGSMALPTIASLSYGDGILSLLDDGNATRAAESFAMTCAAVNAWHGIGVPQNLGLTNMAREAHLNRLVSLARVRPVEAARDALSDYVPHGTPFHDYLLARVVVEGIAVGHAHKMTKLIATCRPRLEKLAASDDRTYRIAAQDALFMMAGDFERSGLGSHAVNFYEKCVEACLREALLGRHEIALLRHSVTALERLGSPTREAQAILARITFPEPLPEAFFAADVFWRDARGVFVEGWAHLGSTPVTGISVSHGAVTVDAQTKQRPDIRQMHPEVPENSSPVFRAYIPGGRGEYLDITMTTPTGNMIVRWQMPLEPLPRVHGTSSETFPSMSESGVAASLFSERSAIEFHDAIRSAVADAVDGPVLAIGIRTDNIEQLEATRAIFGDREVVSLDIHPGNGVDIVADIHDLRSTFTDGHFAVVYSENVLEHLAMPWVGALEMLRVLKLGGVVAHSVPWIWPSHSQPNDFFRISADGLEQLFSPMIGCHTIAKGEGQPARVIPEPQWRSDIFVDMPSLVSPSKSWIVSQKFSDDASRATWPYDTVNGKLRSSDYPVEGVLRDWSSR